MNVQDVTIYIVDDHPQVRSSLANLINCSTPYGVRVFESAAGYLESNELGDGVLLVDHIMPDMNGIELLKRLRSANDTTPFILMTGNLDHDAAEAALAAGADGLIEKPFRLATILGQIDQALTNSEPPYRSSAASSS